MRTQVFNPSPSSPLPASPRADAFSFPFLTASGLIIDRLPDGQIKYASRKIKVQPLWKKYSDFPNR
jgi:hypothetical protein